MGSDAPPNDPPHGLTDEQRLRRDDIVLSMLVWLDSLQTLRDLQPTLVKLRAPDLLRIHQYVSVLIKIDRATGRLKGLQPSAEVASALRAFRGAMSSGELNALRNAVEHDDEYLAGQEPEKKRRQIEDSHEEHLERPGNAVLFPNPDVYETAKEGVALMFDRDTYELTSVTWRGKTYDLKLLVDAAIELGDVVASWVETDPEMARASEALSRRRLTHNHVAEILLRD